MLKLLKDAFKVKDIRSKILFTVFVLFVFRLGAHITVPCLLYTSDAADEEDSVDLCGRRIIEKKKKRNHNIG